MKKYRKKKRSNRLGCCPNCGATGHHFVWPSGDAIGSFVCERTVPLGFKCWYQKLLNINTNHGEFGLEYPLGACCYRDVLRHKEVKKSLRKAWNEIIGQDKGIIEYD